MRFWKRKKKKRQHFLSKKRDKIESELAMRLHKGLIAARKESTGLYRQIVSLRKYVSWIEGELVTTALDRDKLLAWWEKYKDKLEKMETEND